MMAGNNQANNPNTGRDGKDDAHRTGVGVMSGMDPSKLFARALNHESTEMSSEPWVAPEVDELEIWLQGYKVEKLIGRGGMGAVYKVFHKGLERVCALKLLPSSVSQRVDFEERFLHEARAMAKLHHPHIAHVYDSGRSPNGHLYYVMEYVEGEELKDLIEGGVADPKMTLDVIGQVCEALEYAHGKGCIHRDIKPSNVMLNMEGQVKVVDFGIAKMLGDQSEGGLDSSVTMVGEVMGTPGYMSPEQTSGAGVDHRTDIYALGVIMYEMLTGSLPLGSFEPPSQKAGVAEWWDDVVMRALKQNPDERYQSVTELKDVINDPTSTRAKAKGFGRKTFVVMGLLLAVVVYMVSSWADRTNKSQDTVTLPVLAEAHANSMGMQFVPLKGTDVLFGESEARWSDWHAFLSDTGYSWTSPVSNRTDDHPALHISWQDAHAFCQWMTKKEQAEGRIGPGMRYRLPSDDEWSKAAGLSVEMGNTPEERSGKVTGVYPWGRAWPPPESVAEGLGLSDESIDVVRSVRGAYQFMAEPMNPDKIEDYKRVSFSLYRRPWKYGLKGIAVDFVGLPQFAGQIQVLASDQAEIRYWKDKTVVLLGSWMGNHAQWTFPKVGWNSADWTDEGFRDFFVNTEWGQGSFMVWTPAVWNDRDGTWLQGGNVFPRVVLGRDSEGVVDRQLLGEFSGEKLLFHTEEVTAEGRAIVIFDGELSQEDLRKQAESAYEKLQNLWYREADATCLTLLPKYENQWLTVSRAVTAPPVNHLGIRGLAGGAKEWVGDAYGNSEDRQRTLRGGSMRLLGRGPTEDEMKAADGRVVDYVMRYAIAPEDELLSSHRQPESPETRRPWYGFRVVLEIAE